MLEPTDRASDGRADQAGGGGGITKGPHGHCEDSAFSLSDAGALRGRGAGDSGLRHWSDKIKCRFYKAHLVAGGEVTEVKSRTRTFKEASMWCFGMG